MIPRLKPPIGLAELRAVLRLPASDSVSSFERKFARLSQQKYAIAFPYGRTGLYLLLKALGLHRNEIICPAYTCVVVPHAIVFSGNRPVFMDCADNHFNMDLEKIESAITPRTGAIIATSLFGYPVDLNRISYIRKRHPDIHIIQDCAHSFLSQWEGRPVNRAGIAAVFGLNISKTLTSIFGGMITSDDRHLHRRLLRERDQHLQPATVKKEMMRLAYLLATYPAFSSPFYGLINKIERAGFLRRFVDYYDEAVIDMPPDFNTRMSQVEAAAGIVNIDRYESIINRRRAAARYYFDHLKSTDRFQLPPDISGATYSHFVVRVPDRNVWLKKGMAAGIQLGELIEYSIPEMESYGCNPPASFPIAGRYSRTSINLPVWGGVHIAARVVKGLLS